MLKIKNPIPSSQDQWLIEIAKAYNDARETIPFGEFVNVAIKDKDLFHLAPSICLTFRGIRRTQKVLKKITEAALSSYVATCDEGDGLVMQNPLMAFAMCYVASHFGVDLINEEDAIPLLKYVADHLDALQSLIDDDELYYDSSWDKPGNSKAYRQKAIEWEGRHWEEWLKDHLSFPFEVKRMDDDDDAFFDKVAQGKPFRLGHVFNVLAISYEDDLRGIIVKTREGRLAGSVPLCDVEVTSKHNLNYWSVKEYAVWFANR